MRFTIKIYSATKAYSIVSAGTVPYRNGSLLSVK